MTEDSANTPHVPLFGNGVDIAETYSSAVAQHPLSSNTSSTVSPSPGWSSAFFCIKPFTRFKNHVRHCAPFSPRCCNVSAVLIFCAALALHMPYPMKIAANRQFPSDGISSLSNVSVCGILVKRLWPHTPESGGLLPCWNFWRRRAIFSNPASDEGAAKGQSSVA